MDDLHFRDAVAGDDLAVRAIVESVLREYGLEPDPANTDSDLNDIVQNYMARGGIFRVLVSVNGEIVGCGGLYPLNKEEAEIRKMYLFTHVRGRGYGRRLLQELVEAARMRGFN